MSRYINADDLLNRALADVIEFRDFDGIYETGVTIKDLMKITDKMPEAVVRCKGCEFYDCKRNAGLKNNGYCEVYKGYKKADGFCDIGERRKSDADIH